MWKFRARPQPATEPKPEPAIAVLEGRLARLEDSVRTQEKGLKVLELEWQEWFDKFRLLYVRLSKRLKDWQKVSDDSPEPQNGAQEAVESTRDRIPGYGSPAMPIGGPRPTRRNY